MRMWQILAIFGALITGCSPGGFQYCWNGELDRATGAECALGPDGGDGAGSGGGDGDGGDGGGAD